LKPKLPCGDSLGRENFFLKTTEIRTRVKSIVAGFFHEKAIYEITFTTMTENKKKNQYSSSKLVLSPTYTGKKEF
jgi:hypothetical protein